MKQTILLSAVVILWCIPVFAGDNDDAERAYCKYVMEQAIAERDLLRTPSAIVGPTQPSAGTPAQMVFGITASLASNLKAPLTVKAARTSCELYAAAAEAQQHIESAASRLERDALVNRS